MKHRPTILYFVILLLATGSLRTLSRNRDWRSRESLLRAGLMMLPHNAKMHYNYANFLRDSSRPELAKTHYHTALKLWPTYASVHNNLGTLLSDKTEAENHFLAAIRFSADHVNAHFNLGQLYRNTNRSSESENMLRKCIALDPKFTPAYVELTKLRGPDDPGINELLRTAIAASPSDPYFGINLGRWLTKIGNYYEALNYFWKTLKITPTHQEAIAGAAKLLRKLGQKSRLFQLQTRWQMIKRSQKGGFSQTSHILYLHEWQLKVELSSRAKQYDNNYILDKNKTASHKTVHSASEEFLVKWASRMLKNETASTSRKKHSKTEGTLQNPDSTPLMLLLCRLRLLSSSKGHDLETARLSSVLEVLIVATLLVIRPKVHSSQGGFVDNEDQDTALQISDGGPPILTSL
ncbi:hypothetical protein JTB14_025145 [Gonioctena quinquepunctata]|nr:hypothetical protein JTB14_025145 [Gonioctena quinquepunctata]